MEGPTYVTLSAQIALRKQLEIIANNVANANTTGFKADRQLFQTYVDRLNVPGGNVAFVQDRATYIDREAGPIQTTDNKLDVAVQGDGYLSVDSPQGTLYTRDGHLQVSTDGTLQDSSGRSVLSPDGTPIQLPDQYTDLQILGDGTINASVNGTYQNVGQIGTFRPLDALTLRKTGDGLFTAPAGGMQPIDPDDPDSHLVQGALEGSTVQPVREIASLTELSRAYDQLETLIGDDNDRERKMISTLGQSA
jgi:flagellar basal-body rod protein FlgF